MHKKQMMYKLIAFVALCFTSVMLKSESCTSEKLCSLLHKKQVKQIIIKDEKNFTNDDFKNDFFIIKI